jgi:hypothetical protein
MSKVEAKALLDKAANGEELTIEEKNNLLEALRIVSQIV